jgi:HSP20 family protein
MHNRKAYYNNACQHQANRFGTQGEHPLKKMWKEKMNAQFNTPPVNVRETDNSYELYLFAPGYEKSDFVIALTDQVLNISVEDKKETEGNWKRQEYTQKGFLRQFELNEKTDSTAIAATYKNGVLILNLPKLEGFETERHEIEID